MSPALKPRLALIRNGVLASHTGATLAGVSLVAAVAVGGPTLAHPAPAVSGHPNAAATAIEFDLVPDRGRAAESLPAADASPHRGVVFRAPVTMRTARLSAPTRHRLLGRQMMLRRGWPVRQWSALDQLWTKESGWRKHADNPYSSAYGIPQAMVSVHRLHGTRYMTSARAQIRWGLNYITDRYGSPRRAWRHSQRHGWY